MQANRQWIVDTSRLKSEAGAVWTPEDHASLVGHLHTLDDLTFKLVENARKQTRAAMALPVPRKSRRTVEVGS